MSTDLQNYEPTTDEERMASARAVHDQRKRQDATVLIDDLTDREHILIEIAYLRGVLMTRTKLEKAIGVTAETLNANVMRGVIAECNGHIATRPMAPMTWHAPEMLAIAETAARRIRAENDGR